MTTYDGTVTAARDWGQPPMVHKVRPAQAGSIEELLHHVGLDSLLLSPSPGTAAYRELDRVYGERAIGVVYRPETERESHYLTANPARQFDAIVHIDRTTAIAPLDEDVPWAGYEPPETYPTAL
jgi:erythromycin esterase-like protein